MQIKSWLAGLCGRLPTIWAVAALATLSSQPASAGLDYGFEPERQGTAQVSEPPQGPFHTRAIAVPTNRFRQNWDRLVEGFPGKTGLSDICAHARGICPAAIDRWVSYLSEIRNLPRKKQIALVNRYVNWHIRYTDDRIAYGSKDYWASPMQSMGGRGDCEDYATAKYFSLLSLGFSDDQIRLVIVRDDSIGELHALTTVSLDGETYVLDNRFERVLRDSQISTYRPIYSFNRNQNWMHLPS